MVRGIAEEAWVAHLGSSAHVKDEAGPPARGSVLGESRLPSPVAPPCPPTWTPWRTLCPENRRSRCFSPWGSWPLLFSVPVGLWAPGREAGAICHEGQNPCLWEWNKPSAVRSGPFRSTGNGARAEFWAGGQVRRTGTVQKGPRERSCGIGREMCPPRPAPVSEFQSFRTFL